MLLFPDGSFERDIDIDELRISCGGHYGKAIVLTKTAITYRNTVHPTIGYMSFPEGYFETKTIPISHEQFLKLSDAIHAAGLLELFRKPCEHTMYPGAVYQTMSCVFDDCAHFEYMTRGTPDKEFNDIVEILLPLCDFPKDEMISFQETVVPQVKCYETKCCGVVVLDEWEFCPKCGQMLTAQNKSETDKVFDMDETMWLCEHCGEGVPLIYQYCGKCGKKRTW